jgi:hypothetical protein
MKQLLLVLFIVVVAANVAFAGAPMTAKGDKSIGFWMNGLGDFGVGGVNVAGGIQGLSFRYYLSQDMALRANVGFGTATTKTPQGTAGDNENTGTAMAFRPGLVWHSATVAGSISPYWGIEGMFGWQKNSFKPAGGGAETSNSGTLFGAGVFMGGEWYAWDGISFNAEYNLGFTSTTSKTEAGGTSVDGPSTTSIGISSWAVGLNVYWGGAQ